MKNFEVILKVLKKNGSEWWNLFPQQIKYFVQNIDRLLKYPQEHYGLNKKEMVEKINQNIDEIENSFGGFGIVLEKKTSTMPKLLRPKNTKEDNLERNFIEELVKNLVPVLREYFKINFSTTSLSDNNNVDQSLEENSNTK